MNNQSTQGMLFRVTAFCTALVFFQATLVVSSQAAFVDSARQKSPAGQDLEKIQRTLERKQIRSRLRELGYTQQEIEERLQRLNDEQIHSLADRVDTLKAGGGAGEVIVAVAVVFLILLIMDHHGHVDIFR